MPKLKQFHCKGCDCNVYFENAPQACPYCGSQDIQEVESCPFYEQRKVKTREDDDGMN